MVRRLPDLQAQHLQTHQLQAVTDAAPQSSGFKKQHLTSAAQTLHPLQAHSLCEHNQVQVAAGTFALTLKGS